MAEDRSDAHAESIGDLLARCSLTPEALQNAGPDVVEARLRDLVAALYGADALRRELVATTVKKVLRETVKMPGAVVAAALGHDDRDEGAAVETFVADDEPWPDPVKEGLASLLADPVYPRLEDDERRRRWRRA